MKSTSGDFGNGNIDLKNCNSLLIKTLKDAQEILQKFTKIPEFELKFETRPYRYPNHNILKLNKNIVHREVIMRTTCINILKI